MPKRIAWDSNGCSSWYRIYDIAVPSSNCFVLRCRSPRSQEITAQGSRAENLPSPHQMKLDFYLLLLLFLPPWLQQFAHSWWILVKHRSRGSRAKLKSARSCLKTIASNVTGRAPKILQWSKCRATMRKCQSEIPLANSEEQENVSVFCPTVRPFDDGAYFLAGLCIPCSLRCGDRVGQSK